MFEHRNYVRLFPIEDKIQGCFGRRIFRISRWSV